ncbi:hypothetical protein EYF80_001987 [Liparis tanakae]|uniref:Uncharacterized protein n=1 Tax=Liparis tanakae TaxID=230148 RepID=A0A4Z2JBW9_9TELE|nr:hypothetical protein EYF80_001987 [Liparis tanakae]
MGSWQQAASLRLSPSLQPSPLSLVFPPPLAHTYELKPPDRKYRLGSQRGVPNSNQPRGKKGHLGSDDDDDLEELLDMSNDEGVEGEDSDEDDEVPSKAPQPLSSSALIKLAEGDEDVVEDLELSDDD